MFNSIKWDTIWKQKGPRRWQFILWFIKHNKLLTSAEKARRHLQEDASCNICGACTETALHAVRDCVWIKKIWKELVVSPKWEQFFEMPLEEWVDWNLKDGRAGKLQTISWVVLFKLVVYFAWSGRNEFCIKGDDKKTPGARGLLRDILGRWQGYQRVILELDSVTSISLVRGNVQDSTHHNLIAQVKQALRRDGESKISRTWREGNVCADYLAKKSINMDLVFQRLRNPPDELIEG
ncbi:uncharacterized protein [Coffea arabica]|uniref:Uncharacterized protein n=1 Tax=Coffea arabica TaxID=13443 RepID=A0A6P6TCP9_COFAR|nr:uncharacterized protein LOC113699487 [Coffea arabica]